MKDEIFGTMPAEFRSMTIEPPVVRLPDGHVRVYRSGARFPNTCPRCGRSPAETEVKLGFMKLKLASFTRNRSIKVPFCSRCGRTLKTARVISAILGALAVAAAESLISNRNLLPKIPPGFAAMIAAAVAAAVVGALFEWAPNVFVRAGVEVVGMGKDFTDLAFDDQMYAERFVELNRPSFSTATSRPSGRRWSPGSEGSAQPSTGRGFRPPWRVSIRRENRS